MWLLLQQSYEKSAFKIFYGQTALFTKYIYIYIFFSSLITVGNKSAPHTFLKSGNRKWRGIGAKQMARS